jgi:hypothetical protein
MTKLPKKGVEWVDSMNLTISDQNVAAQQVSKTGTSPVKAT